MRRSRARAAAPPPPPPRAAGRDRRRGAAARQPAGGGFGATVQGLSIVKPPYGQIVAHQPRSRAISMWSTPHGDTPDAVRNHPALQGA